MAKKPEAKKPEDQIDGTESEALDTETSETLEETAPLELHKQIERAVASVLTSGGPDMVHALHKVETLTGSLKHSLPAAIAFTTDESLKSGLEALLAML